MKTQAAAAGLRACQCPKGKDGEQLREERGSRTKCRARGSAGGEGAQGRDRGAERPRVGPGRRKGREEAQETK